MLDKTIIIPAEPEQKINKQRDICLIFGRTGSGKSHLTHKLVLRLNRYIIIDVKYEYNEGIIFTDLESVTEYLKENYTVDGELKIIIRFKKENELKYFFEICEELQNITLVLEEAEIYISAQTKKGSFLKLVRQGRHNAISIIAVARRVPELHSDIRANCNIIYSFKQVNKKDIMYLQDFGFTRVDKLELYEYEVQTF